MSLYLLNMACSEVERGVSETLEVVDSFSGQAIENQFARGFEVHEFKNYRVVTVRNPWQNAEVYFSYVLKSAVAKVSDQHVELPTIEVPIKHITCISTTHLSMLKALGVSDALVGFSNGDFIYDVELSQKVENGQIAEIGSEESLNFEILAELQPDVVMTYGLDAGSYAALQKLDELQIPFVFNAEFLENHPLGQAEWIKFMALFFGLEERADSIFSGIANEYQATKMQVMYKSSMPSVFTGKSWKGSWTVPGGRSFAATFLRDAGAKYLWVADTSRGNLFLDFEAVYARAAEAQFWLQPGTSSTMDGLLAGDERHMKFSAFKNGTVFNNNARLNEHGSNDYWESGTLNVHIVLKDLVKIFHPDLLPEHELFYYQKLE